MTAPPFVFPRQERVDRVSFLLSATQQKVLGYFFLLHGLAHAAIGIWAAESGRWWMIASLWELAMVGFIAAGLGALGVAGFRDLWRGSTMLAAAASILLFLTSPDKAFLPGLCADIAAFALVFYAQSASPTSDRAGGKHRIRRISGIIISWLLIGYVAVVLAIRPWNIQWGTTAEERAMPLPGDQLVPVAHYRIDHGITINAPATAVWPWLIQIGQDRGGFYSYSTLEGWGVFALVPVDDSTTKVLVRTRGLGVPSQLSVAVSPLNLLVFEPAHLIMERRMLIGLRERAEQSLDKTFLAGQ